MLGLLLLYFIGKYFNELAKAHNKKNVLWIIVGIASFYVSAIIGLMIIAIVNPNIFDESDILLNLISFPFGVGGCIGLYQILKKSWSKVPSNLEEELEFFGKSDNNSNG